MLKSKLNTSSHRDNHGFNVGRVDLRKSNFEIRFTWKILWGTIIEIYREVVLFSISSMFLWLRFCYLTIKDKGWKFDHCFILKDGVSVASDTYWQEPSYFVPSSVCIIIFYHHTVFEINNESWFSLKQPHKQESVFLSTWSGGELFRFVRKQCLCDLR